LTDTHAEDLAALWSGARTDLRESVLESTFDLWLAPLKPAVLRGDTLYLTAPPAAIAWVERRYLGLIGSAVRRHAVDVTTIALLPAGEEPPPGTGESAAFAEPPNLDYTFERFVIGPGARLAHAAALAVAESPGEAYNPLFLFGPPGLGKTHLLGAIANYIAFNHPTMSVLYTTAERFTAEFVGALRAEGLGTFKQRHRQLDVLLIDDVQFLVGKTRTADEFFHTFNALYEAGSQIVLSSDRPPAELEPLADRLRDRFEWGLHAEIDLPDLATRQVILRRLAREAELPPDTAGAIDSLAASAGGNVRRLQGALTRLIAHSSLQGRSIDAELAAFVLGSDVPAGGDDDVERITRAVAARHGTEPERIASGGRAPELVRARHIAIYLCRELTQLSLPQIGARFDRDHSTVLHAVRKIEREIANDPGTAEAIHSIRAELTAGKA
jgi:chromosomal replication initiator protein